MHAEFGIGRLSGELSLHWRTQKRSDALEEANADGVRRSEPAPFTRESYFTVGSVNERALRWLYEHLLPSQAEQFRATGMFEVCGNLGNRYRIRRAPQQNVDQLDAQGKIVRTFCAAPYGVPLGDKLLAQKLLIECDEFTFACIANTTVPRNPEHGELESGEGGEEDAG